MKFLVFSDLHAHNYQAYSKPTPSGGNTRLLDTMRVLSFIREKSQETGIKDVIFAGDLFESKNRIPVVVLNAIYRELDEWRAEDMTLIMIPGNHDLAVRSGDEHALEVLQEFGMVSLISVPSWVRWETSTGEIVGVTAVPFRERFKESWFDIMQDGLGVTSDSLRICVAHGIVQGSLSRLDDDTPLSYHTNESLIPLSWLSPFDFSIIGHVHLPQVIEDKILIPGQSWQQFPHEGKQDRGIWEVEVEKGKKPFLKKHSVEGVPRFVSAVVSREGSLRWKVGDGGGDIHPSKGNIVLLAPEDVQVPSKVLSDTERSFLEYGAVYVEVLPPESIAITEQPRVVVDVKESPYITLKKTISSGHVSLEGHSEESVFALGEQIIQQVLEEENE